MSRDPDTKTVFKLRITRQSRDLWILLKMIACFCGMLALIGGCQYYPCHVNHPRWTVMECLSP